MSKVDHPEHYGGVNNPYKAIKVIEAWELGFHLGNAVKYISRAGKKDPAKEAEDLKKAAWYINRQIIWRSSMGNKTIKEAADGLQKSLNDLRRTNLVQAISETIIANPKDPKFAAQCVIVTLGSCLAAQSHDELGTKVMELLGEI